MKKLTHSLPAKGIALLLLLVYPLGLSHLFSQLKKKAAAFFAGRKKTQKEG